MQFRAESERIRGDPEWETSMLANVISKASCRSGKTKNTTSSEVAAELRGPGNVLDFDRLLDPARTSDVNTPSLGLISDPL